MWNFPEFAGGFILLAGLATLGGTIANRMKLLEDEDVEELPND
jgi:hypothetical protein